MDNNIFILHVFILVIMGILYYMIIKHVTLASNTGVPKKVMITILSLLTIVIIAFVFLLNNFAVYSYLKEFFNSVSTF